MRRSLLIAGLGLVSSAGIALAVWMRPVPPPVLPEAVAPTEEAAALTASNGLAWRDGAGLSLRLKTGEVLTLPDRASCGDVACPKGVSVRYRYLGWDVQQAGYKLALESDGGIIASEVVVPFADDAAMIDVRHAEPPINGPLPQPVPPASAHQDDGLAEWLSDIASARAKDEAPRLAKAKGKAIRDGAHLVLTLEGGRRLTLTDDLSCGQVACPTQVFRNFDYAGLSPDGRYHVIGEHWDEASAALLVSARDGTATSLLGVPSFSPDGKRAVATVTDLEWSAPRRLEVWNLSGASPVLEFSLPAAEGDDTVYEALSWADADHLHLTKSAWGREGGPIMQALLAHHGDGWKIEAGEGPN